MNFYTNTKCLGISLLIGLGLPMAAQATLIGNSYSYVISASVGNPVTGGDLPLFGGSVAVAGLDFSHVSGNLITFTSSGFGQTMAGTVSFDLASESITVGFIGTAQGVGLNFDFTGLNWGTINPGEIVGISLGSQSCTGGGISCVQSGSVFRVPTFTGDSVTGLGINLSGFQPGTVFSQTYNLEVEHSQEPPPPTVPVPGTLVLLGLGLAMMGWRKRGAHNA